MIAAEIFIGTVDSLTCGLPRAAAASLTRALNCPLKPGFLMNTPILIPAFQPGPQLPALIERLAQSAVPAIVIVDDGSSPECAEIFELCATFPQVHPLRHETNLGKGAAIKTGIRYILETFPDCTGAVTADADGQHDPADILRIASALEQNPDCLVLGARQFDRQVPVRSRIGNLATRALARAILGQRVQDSQTGLRGLPRKLLPYLCDLPSSGYEFELDMLIAAKHLGLAVVEEPIETIYAPGNPTSHFDPLRDSMKIYFVLVPLQPAVARDCGGGQHRVLLRLPRNGHHTRISSDEPHCRRPV